MPAPCVVIDPPQSGTLRGGAGGARSATQQSHPAGKPCRSRANPDSARWRCPQGLEGRGAFSIGCLKTKVARDCCRPRAMNRSWRGSGEDYESRGFGTRLVAAAGACH